MAIKPIIHFPDPILLNPSQEVVDPSTPEIANLITDLKDTLMKAEGLGLAAPQIAVPLKVVAINYRKDIFALINPKITWVSDGVSPLEEGCLSLPDVFVTVNRPKKVAVSALNEQGEPIEIRANDLLAKILQHEIDHINGVLITNYQQRL